MIPKLTKMDPTTAYRNYGPSIIAVILLLMSLMFINTKYSAQVSTMTFISSVNDLLFNQSEATSK